MHLVMQHLKHDPIIAHSLTNIDTAVLAGSLRIDVFGQEDGFANIDTSQRHAQR